MLKGKYVIRSEGEYYRVGRVVGTYGPTMLVQFDHAKSIEPGSPPLPMELVCLEEVMHAMDNDIKMWGFFPSRAKLEAFMKWTDAPEEENVVRLVVPRRPKPKPRGGGNTAA